jgi:drug/metabolite transporter (DMT)-like permease
MGFLLQACGNGGVMLAQQTVSSSLASILVSIMPLWAALFSGLLGTWPSRREWMALLLGAAGVLLLGVKGELAGQPWAVGLLLFSSATWALGSVLGRRMDMPPGMAASAAQMLCGGAWVLGIAALRGESMPSWPLPVGPVVAWLYLAIMGSLVGYSAFVFLLRNVRPAVATSYAYVNPVVATLLGVTLAGEHLDAWSAAGSALVLSGVVLLLWRKT